MHFTTSATSVGASEGYRIHARSIPSWYHWEGAEAPRVVHTVAYATVEGASLSRSLS